MQAFLKTCGNNVNKCTSPFIHSVHLWNVSFVFILNFSLVINKDFFVLQTREMALF